MPVSCRTCYSRMSHHSQSHPGASGWRFPKAARCSAAPPPARSWDHQRKRHLAFKLTGTALQLSFLTLTSLALSCPGSCSPVAEDHSPTLLGVPDESEQTIVKQGRSQLLSQGRRPGWASPCPGTLPAAGGEELLGKGSSTCMRAAEAALSSSLAIRVCWTLHI